MPIGRTLQRIRREKRMTQRQVADAIGMDYAYFSRLENDRFNYQPSPETIERIADALDCTEDERNELFAEAGRINKEMEQVARLSTERPEIRELFRTVVGLPPDKVQELTAMARKKLKKSKEHKPKE